MKKTISEIRKCVLTNGVQYMGYTGKMTILRRFIRTIRPKDEKTIIRFETEPGNNFKLTGVVARQ